MKKKTVSVISLCMAGIIVSGSVYGADIKYNVNYSYKDNSLIISGEAADTEHIALQILKKDKSFETAYTKEDVLYAGQKQEENNEFQFVVDYSGSESGNYNAKITSSNGDKSDIILFLNTDSGLESVYAELNSAAEQNDRQAFKDIINNKRNELNFSFSLSDGKVLDTEIDDYMLYLAANRLLVNEEENNKRIFKNFITASELNKSSLKDIDSIVGELYFADNKIREFYDKSAEIKGATEYLTGKISAKNIKQLDDFENVFKEGLILTSVKFSDGIENIQNVLSRYGSVIGINYAVSDEICRQLAQIGNFADGKALKEKIDELKNSVSSSGSVSGSGSGGNGGSGSLPGKGFGSAVTPIKTSFEDIDGVAWASEAIHALADKGIVSGKSDGVFAPDDYITREEFAKMLVCTLGLENAEYTGGSFDDVLEDAWYCKYIHIAKQYNIISGIEQNQFGVGNEITRQDMAVMIYRALVSRGVQLNTADLPFDDTGDISDYAVDAVKALYAEKIVSGMSETEFMPHGKATRAQAAKIIYGILKLIG